MKTIGYFVAILFSFSLLFSCGSSKKTVSKNNPKVEANLSGKAKTVLSTAHKYLGTPYRYGGTTRSGIDCSGLVFNSFQEVRITPPRISRDQAKYGSGIKLNKVEPGDVLFFNTSGSGVSHAGIVDRVKNGEVFFIHASSSKGVIISSLNETYWNKRFVNARRYLN